MSELNEQLKTKLSGIRAFINEGINYCQDSHDAPPAPATKWDHEALHVIGEINDMIEALDATPAPQAAPSAWSLPKEIPFETMKAAERSGISFVSLCRVWEFLVSASPPAVTQAAPSEPVARVNDDHLSQREDAIWKVFVAMQDGLSRNGFQGAVDAGLAAQQSPADARDAVIAAARKWWEGKRPDGWSLTEHASNAACNCYTPAETTLALAIAAATTSTEGR